MNFVETLTTAKNQIGYDDYLHSIYLGQQPREELPLLNRLVNCIADIYCCNATTICLPDGELATVQAIYLCKQLSRENRDQIIQELRNTPITSVQTVLFRNPAQIA